MVKQLLIAILWRILIGVGFGVIGIILCLITNDWRIENWFGGFGLLVMLVAAVPLMGGGSSSKDVAWYLPDGYQKDYENNQKRLDGAMNFSITTIIFGIVNILISLSVYHFHH